MHQKCIQLFVVVFFIVRITPALPWLTYSKSKFYNLSSVDNTVNLLVKKYYQKQMNKILLSFPALSSENPISRSKDE